MTSENDKSHIWCPQKLFPLAGRTFTYYRNFSEMSVPPPTSRSSDDPLRAKGCRDLGEE